MDSPFVSSGLAHVWTQGDWVTRSVALVLLTMSLASWIIILWKALDLRAQRAQARGVEGFWHSSDFAEGLEKLGDAEGNPFRTAAIEGREAARHITHQDGASRPQLHDNLDVSDWIERALRKSVDDFTIRAQGGLSVLASVASTAPFVGLFGTVWGIMNAFGAIAEAGNTNLTTVAPAIAEALFATAIGLAAAIPAYIAYNKFSIDAGKFTGRLESFADDLQAAVARRLGGPSSAAPQPTREF